MLYLINLVYEVLDGTLDSTLRGFCHLCSANNPISRLSTTIILSRVSHSDLSQSSGHKHPLDFRKVVSHCSPYEFCPGSRLLWRGHEVKREKKIAPWNIAITSCSISLFLLFPIRETIRVERDESSARIVHGQGCQMAKFYPFLSSNCAELEVP